MDGWNYEGGRDVIRRREEERRTREEAGRGRRTKYDMQRDRLDSGRYESTNERQHKQIGRKNSGRKMGGEREDRNRYTKRNRAEAIAIHKMEQTESYADILKKAKNSIDIGKLGIEDTRIRTATGSLLIQIVGEESKRQADALADEMRKVIGEEARIGRPCRRAEIRISGLDEDTTAEEVIDAVANYGECDRGDIRTGRIRRNRQGEGDIWVRCPWSSANELSRRGRMKIGWVGARVELTEPSPSSVTAVGSTDT